MRLPGGAMEASRAAQDGLLEDALGRLREVESRLAVAEGTAREAITIVGAAARLPGDVSDLDTMWELLAGGVDAVGPLELREDGRRDLLGDTSAGAQHAGLLSSVDGFDAEFFGISTKEATRMDPQQRLVLEVAWEAIEEAGLPLEDLRIARTGVFLGLYGSDYMAMQLADPSSINVYSGPGCAHSIVANRLSYLLDLHGPSLVIDTACSSSLVAVHLACRALRDGDCDFALAGGVNLILSPLSTMMTEKVLPLAPRGRCRTFDAGAEGIVRGEGCGIVVLERGRDARAAGRRGHASIRGTAVNQDGRTNGLTAPSPRAQRDVLRRALADGGVDPLDVLYVETHGTATPLGDPIEIDALSEVYGAGELPCGLGSLKTNLGHLEAAAGIAGLLKTMLVLERGAIPPHLHLESLNPEIDFAGTRLRVPTRVTPLPRSATPALAGVSAFGFGGTNAHAVLEAIPPVEPLQSPSSSAMVLPISARSPDALAELAHLYADSLLDCDAHQAGEICAAAALRRTHHPHRLAVVAATPEKLIGQLRRGPALLERTGLHGEARALAFVFSGQGSQWVKMGADVLGSQPLVRREVEACDAVVRSLGGWSLLEQLEADETSSRLHQTEVAQLAIASLQLGLAALWRSWGMEPHAVVGHSMGEIAAACVAGAIDRETALEILLLRARIIERAARGGAMASLRLGETEVLQLLEASGGGVSIAALNGPSSTVVGGDAQSVERFLALASSAGAQTRMLPVEYAFHSSLLDGCDRELAGLLGSLSARETEVAIYSTVTGERISSESLDAEHWGRNLRQPVLLRAAVTALAREEAVDLIEIGPHPTLLEDLAATLRECGAQSTVVGSLRRRRPADFALHTSLAELYNAGLRVHWERVLESPVGRVALPFYPWQRRRHWLVEPATAAGPRELRSAFPVERPRRPEASSNGALAKLPVERRQELLTRYVREHVADALGLESIEEVACDVPLEALGLDSLAVVELRNQVEREFSITVALQTLLDGGTAADVARSIAVAMEGMTVAEEAEDPPALQDMSDEDVDAALVLLLNEPVGDD